jgi:hypothetical protein
MGPTIDWYNEKDTAAMLLMDAALHMIAGRLWREFNGKAIGPRERAAFEALAQREREILIRENPVYDDLPRLHMKWDNPAAPSLYFQKMSDETAQAIAEMIMRPL